VCSGCRSAPPIHAIPVLLSYFFRRRRGAGVNWNFVAFGVFIPA